MVVIGGFSSNILLLFVLCLVGFVWVFVCLFVRFWGFFVFCCFIGEIFLWVRSRGMWDWGFFKHELFGRLPEDGR